MLITRKTEEAHIRRSFLSQTTLTLQQKAVNMKAERRRFLLPHIFLPFLRQAETKTRDKQSELLPKFLVWTGNPAIILDKALRKLLHEIYKESERYILTVMELQEVPNIKSSDVRGCGSGSSAGKYVSMTAFEGVTSFSFL